MRIVDIAPRPSSLIESIRDIGYSLGTALADLIDNCIAAQAKSIQVLTTVEGSDLKVGILDDGVGMTEGELLEAMRLGSRSPPGGAGAVRPGPLWAWPEDRLFLPMPGGHHCDPGQRYDDERSMGPELHC